MVLVVVLAAAAAVLGFVWPGWFNSKVLDTTSVQAGVKRVLKTQHHLFMYNASGHGAWEASLTNLLSPGDAILVLESGYFSEEWANMARAHGLEVRLVACDWRRGVDPAQVKSALAADTAHAIKAESGSSASIG